MTFPNDWKELDSDGGLRFESPDGFAYVWADKIEYTITSPAKTLNAWLDNRRDKNPKLFELLFVTEDIDVDLFVGARGKYRWQSE